MAESHLLAVLDHAPGAVVVDDTNEGDVVTDSRIELHGVKAERSVTIEHHHLPVGPGELGSDSVRDAGAQTPEETAGGDKNACPLL